MPGVIGLSFHLGTRNDHFLLVWTTDRLATIQRKRSAWFVSSHLAEETCLSFDPIFQPLMCLSFGEVTPRNDRRSVTMG